VENLCDGFGIDFDERQIMIGKRRFVAGLNGIISYQMYLLEATSAAAM